MRTVSFSSSEIRNLLNKDFVNTFTNTTGDPTAGKSICHSPDDQPGHCFRGVGQQNVQVLFLTPEGKIYHAAAGYRSPDDLLTEIKFAKELFAKLGDSAGDSKEVIRKAHRDRLKEMGFDDEQIEKAISNRPFAGLELLTDDGGDLFEAKSKRADLMSNAFSIKNPLISYQKFTRDPTDLVGKGSSSFVSTSNTNHSEESPKPRKQKKKDRSNPLDQIPELPEGFPVIR